MPKKLLSASLVCGVVLFSAGGLFAQAPPNIAAAQTKLRELLQGKVLTFRVPYQPNKLAYDTAGKVIGSPTRGNWAMDSAMVANIVKLEPSRLEIEGIRVVQFYVDGQVKAVPAPEDDFRIDIALDPADPIGNAGRVLKILLQPASEPQSSTPPPDPKDFQNSRLERDPGPPVRYRVKGTADWKQPAEMDEPIEIGQLEDGERVYTVSRVLTPPKGLKSPDPFYSDIDKKAGREGTILLKTVIDQHGVFHTLSLVKNESGLQLTALGTLRQWRFQPCTINKQPVACEVDMNINLRLRK